MEERVASWTGYLLETWQNATPAQYVPALLAIVLLGWYFSRFWSD